MRAGELKEIIERILQKVFPADTTVTVMISKDLADGTSHTQNGNLNDLRLICDLERDAWGISLTFASEAGTLSGYRHLAEVRLLTFAEFHKTELTITASNVEIYDALIRESVLILDMKEWLSANELKPTSDPDCFQELDELRKRVEKLEAQADQKQHLNCFISIRFDEPSLGYCQSLKSFIELLGTKAVTGLGYEPRTIQAKIKDRLQVSLDVVVVIIPEKGMSQWQRDEIAAAQNEKVHLIVVLEEGATFEKGIYGDHEYIEFPKGRIAEAFMKVAEGIRFIERQRSSLVIGS